MGLDNLAIAKFMDWIADGINDNIDNHILNGMAWLGLGIVMLWFLGYVIGWGFFSGHWIRNLWIIGIWLFVELANFVGGGHDKKN